MLMAPHNLARVSPLQHLRRLPTTSPTALSTLLECCFVFWGKIVSPVLVITVFARGGQGSVLLARPGRAGAGN